MNPATSPGDPLPPEYWGSVLKDPRAGVTGVQLPQRRLSEIQRQSPARLLPTLRAVPWKSRPSTLFASTAGKALWKDVGQRLLDDTCLGEDGQPRGRQVLAVL